jgi:hypothetical protein
MRLYAMRLGKGPSLNQHSKVPDAIGNFVTTS